LQFTLDPLKLAFGLAAALRLGEGRQREREEGGCHPEQREGSAVPGDCGEADSSLRSE
jgi:hypothetical protein